MFTKQPDLEENVMTKTRRKTLMSTIGLTGLLLGMSACGGGTSTHTASELLPALLTVGDLPAELNGTPVEWYENMRKVITSPAPPWENTLDPYLCAEAGTPAILAKDQAQLELTGGSIMQILVSSKDAKDLYIELDDAYKTCDGTATPSYAELIDFEEVGDESSTYKSGQGVVTIARVGNDIMILKWWVGEFYDQVADSYPGIVDTAIGKIESL